MILQTVNSSKLSPELEQLLASGVAGELILNVSPCVAKASRSFGAWATFSAQTSGFQLAQDQITAFLQAHEGSFVDAKWAQNLVRIKLGAAHVRDFAALSWVGRVNLAA